MKRWKVPMLIAGFAAGAALVAAIAWYFTPITDTFFTDSDSIREPADTAQVRDILWQPPVPLSEMINTSAEDYEPRLSWDATVLYFVRGKAGDNADIYYAQRTPTGWTEPHPLDEINTEYDELGPEPSPDGTALYFYSDRPGGIGGYDIWVSRRLDGQWQPPANLGPGVNSEFNDYGAAVVPGSASLYFASNRPLPAEARPNNTQAWPATVREDLFHRTYDIYQASLTDGGAGPAVPVAELLTPYNEGAPCVSPSGDFVYFASDRPGGEGGFDLYRARRINGELEGPTNLGAPVNTPANELDPGLAQLGYALYFSSDRHPSRPASAPATQPTANANKPGTTTLAKSDQIPDYNLYYSSSREVFRTVEQYNRPVDLAALLPWLAWLLLALLLMLLLWALLGAVRDKRLGLLTRCLLASLMAHLLLLLLLSFWKVSAAAYDALNRPGEIRIALAPHDPTDSLAGQIRELAADIQTPAPEDVSLERTPPAIETPTPAVEAELATARAVMTAEPLETPRAVDDAKPEQPRRPVEPVVAQSSDEPKLDVTLPQESARIDAHERQTDTPVAAKASPLTRDAIKVATSQPVRPPREFAPSPATASSRQSFADANTLMPKVEAPDVTAPDSPRAARLPDAKPATSTRISLDVELPAESAKPAASKAEQAVHVAAAPAPTVPLPDLPQVRTESRAPVATLEPIARPSEFALASSVEIIPTETEAPGSSRERRKPIRPSASHAPLSNLALPTLEEAGPAATHETERPVAAAASCEPKLAKAPLNPPQSAYSATVELAPAAAARSAKVETATPFSPKQVTDARPQLKRLNGPLASVQPSPGLAQAMDLRIPIETLENQPARSDSQTNIAAAREWAAGKDGLGDGRLIGVIYGRVTDEESAEPLADAIVRLDLPDSRAIIVRTDEQGEYALPIPEVPDNFALTAARDGFVPGSANIPVAQLRDGLFQQDFDLEPTSQMVITLESSPVVHHLGNDRWEGRINSQFQRNAEGRTYEATFTVSAEQMQMRPTEAAVKLLAKGVQCPHRVQINGKTVGRRLTESPDDGSFGGAVIPFDADWLEAGENTLEIRAGSCLGDIDDFEFVNVTIELQ